MPQEPSSDARTQPKPYTIRLLVHPSPIRVSYATVASLIPTLLQQHNPDYIFHIGVAGGRSTYTLETIGHRDNYKIKDVDDRDGWKEGEFEWKRDSVPARLHVGWDEENVADRWQREVTQRETKLGLVDGEDLRATPTERFSEWLRKDRKRQISKCQLSNDAGRFLCEFTLFESLAQRWLEVEEGDGDKDVARDRLGKVAFLHVPGGYDEEAVQRGARVAEAAIRSLVASWEEGRRHKDGQEEKLLGTGKLDKGKWDGVIWKG